MAKSLSENDRLMQLFPISTINRTKPPLPFNGNKRNFLKGFLNILKSSQLDLNQYTIIDLFGGSGFLSHHCKKHRPNARVIYNDFDGYQQRCKRIAETEELRKRLYENITVKYNIKSPLKEKEEVLTKLYQHQAKYGRLDIDTLSAWLLFSGQGAKSLEEMSKHEFYNKVPQRSLEKVEGYLDGLEIVSKDYQELIKENEGKNQTLFLFDPPYLNTDNSRYTMKEQRSLKDYLDIVLHLSGKQFVFFTSEKSHMLEFIEWSREQGLLDEVYKLRKRENPVNNNTKYQDIMIYNI